MRNRIPRRAFKSFVKNTYHVPHTCRAPHTCLKLKWISNIVCEPISCLSWVTEDPAFADSKKFEDLTSELDVELDQLSCKNVRVPSSQQDFGKWNNFCIYLIKISMKDITKLLLVLQMKSKMQAQYCLIHWLAFYKSMRRKFQRLREFSNKSRSWIPCVTA